MNHDRTDIATDWDAYKRLVDAEADPPGSDLDTFLEFWSAEEPTAFELRGLLAYYLTFSDFPSDWEAFHDALAYDGEYQSPEDFVRKALPRGSQARISWEADCIDPSYTDAITDSQVADMLAGSRNFGYAMTQLGEATWVFFTP